jgi:TorA maturation chaperone TorD
MERMQKSSSPDSSERVVDEFDRARAEEYALLATLLSRSPDSRLISGLARLKGDASPIGVAHAALGEAAGRATEDRAKREYFDLFTGLGGETFQTLGIEKAAGQSEPEDHVAILCEIMAGLVGGGIAAPAGADRDFFKTHLAPWIRRFFVDLEHAETADFYARVGSLGRAFVDIETEAFALSA